jgi:hypothetical protein
MRKQQAYHQTEARQIHAAEETAISDATTRLSSSTWRLLHVQFISKYVDEYLRDTDNDLMIKKQILSFLPSPDHVFEDHLKVFGHDMWKDQPTLEGRDRTAGPLTRIRELNTEQPFFSRSRLQKECKAGDSILILTYESGEFLEYFDDWTDDWFVPDQLFEIPLKFGIVECRLDDKATVTVGRFIPFQDLFQYEFGPRKFKLFDHRQLRTAQEDSRFQDHEKSLVCIRYLVHLAQYCSDCDVYEDLLFHKLPDQRWTCNMHITRFCHEADYMLAGCQELTATEIAFYKLE